MEGGKVNAHFFFMESIVLCVPKMVAALTYILGS